jgi:hypothetical protein
MLVSIEDGTLASGTPDASCTGFTASGVYRMGSSAIDTTGDFSGGVAPGSLSTENYATWATSATKYYRIKVALPPNVSNALQNLSATLQFTWTASQPSGSTSR